MIEVTLVGSTPQEAYQLAKKKYQDSFRLISARQIALTDEDRISCEITISVGRDQFLEIDDDEDEEVLLDELAQLREHITLMKEHLVESQFKTSPLIEKVKSFFIKRGIEEHLIEGVLSSLIGTPVADDDKLLVAYILEEIDESLHIKKEDLREKKVKMFVGPTGVGKTTTVAKLAARYAFMMDSSYRVALINLDSFKVGAFEQLAHFANVMELQHFSVRNMSEFEEIYTSLDGYDLILIDTAGMSPYDAHKLVKTVEYLSIGEKQEIEVNLVISTTVKYEDLKVIHETFSFLNLDSVILSKFDETRHLGSIISYLMQYPVALSYFTMGQNVPDDLIVANKEYLLQHFIGDVNA